MPIARGGRYIQRMGCRVCGGKGVVGWEHEPCPACGGKGYILDSEYHYSGSHFSLKCFPIALAVTALLAAAFFHVFYASWQGVKWLIIVPIIVLLLTFLPNIIRWVRKRGEDK
jgi:hypothetical protein